MEPPRITMVEICEIRFSTAILCSATSLDQRFSRGSTALNRIGWGSRPAWTSHTWHPRVLKVREMDGSLRQKPTSNSPILRKSAPAGSSRVPHRQASGSPSLPGSVYRLGWDLTLATPIVGLWSMQLDFNPSLDTDFNGGLGREALQLDGNAMLFYRASPQWMIVLGAGYWDRVDKIILPYAGVVWNPNDQWEVRLLFPKSRISYFLGNINHGAHWLYASGEYHVESYQINQPGVSSQQQVQMQDWRFAVGVRSDHVTYDKFIELGVVFGRNVDFKTVTPGFNFNDTLMLRAGVKF
jgi:hypothetical protein